MLCGRYRLGVLRDKKYIYYNLFFYRENIEREILSLFYFIEEDFVFRLENLFKVI